MMNAPRTMLEKSRFFSFSDKGAMIRKRIRHRAYRRISSSPSMRPIEKAIAIMRSNAVSASGYLRGRSFFSESPLIQVQRAKNTRNNERYKEAEAVIGIAEYVVAKSKGRVKINRLSIESIVARFYSKDR